MSKKVALCRVSDTEPLLSLVTMLEYAGYECVLPDRGIRDYLRSIGCTNVDEFEDMRDRWGAEMPPSRLREISHDYVNEQAAWNSVDLYVDVNAFHNGPLLWRHWPRMESRTLCYFINGGPPRSMPDKGDGITPACPVMTTNQWYRLSTTQRKVGDTWIYQSYADVPPWKDKSYVFYPSFERWDRIVPRRPNFTGSPVCFCHNVMGWGYGEYVEEARKLGCKFYGGGNSPDGLVPHGAVFERLASAPCVVYLKGGGAVDYAVLEAMAIGVPVFVTDQYRNDTKLQELLPYNWGHKNNLVPEVAAFLQRQKNPMTNFSDGELSKKLVRDLCWQPERDGPGFVEWLRRMFP